MIVNFFAISAKFPAISRNFPQFKWRKSSCEKNQIFAFIIFFPQIAKFNLFNGLAKANHFPHFRGGSTSYFRKQCSKIAN
jgi:hypothetical protein